VLFFFILIANSSELNTSPSLTMDGFGFGNWIPTDHVPGIGAITLSDLVLSERDRSFASFSIVETLIPASGLILIWTMDGPISNHSICTGTLNSISLFCNALALSMRNLSSMACVLPWSESNKEIPNVGLSEENDMFCLGFAFVVSCFWELILSSNFFLIMVLSMCCSCVLFDWDESSSLGISFCCASDIFFHISLSLLALDLAFLGFLSCLILMLSLGSVKLNVYKTRHTAVINNMMINALMAIF